MDEISNTSTNESGRQYVIRKGSRVDTPPPECPFTLRTRSYNFPHIPTACNQYSVEEVQSRFLWWGRFVRICASWGVVYTGVV